MSERTGLHRGEGANHDVLVEARAVTVDFDMEHGSSRVLDEVSLDIHRDEVVGLVGESGSGKSMFASALLDAVVAPGRVSGEVIYHPDDGDPFDILSLDDEAVKEFRWEEVSMVFQGAMSSFNPTMKIGGHFEETIRAHDRNLDDRMEHARRLLSDVYLDPERVLDSYPHELSGGMQQRALIALSLVLEPDVLVMDEPTAALDLLMQRTITRLLKQLKESYELTIIFITHDLPLVAGLADRLVVMYAFQFVEFGSTIEILENAAHPYTRALLKAVPSIESPIDEMRPIEGDSPDPVSVPSGCSYHPRCPLAEEECVESEPTLLTFDEFEEGRRVRCWFADEAPEAIPYTLSERDGGDDS